MKIGVWGDSIVYGVGDETSLGWVGRMRTHLQAKGIAVCNQGVGGDTTEDLLKRFETELHSIDPDLILFAIGINDAVVLRGNTVVPLPTFKKNMQTLLSRAQQRIGKVMVVGIADVDFEMAEIAKWFRSEDVRSFDSCLEEVVREMQVPYISMRNVLDVQRDLVDGIHPNAEGYKKMSDAILPVVESAVKSLSQ